MVLWFAFILLVSNWVPTIALYLLVLAPIAGWVIAWILPGTPYDFQGMLFVGTAACSLIARGIFSTLQYKAAGYTLLTRIVDLTELGSMIVVGMLMGFFGSRYLVKSLRPGGL